MPHIGEKADLMVSRGAAQTVPVTASPFTYTAPANGMVLISGGTVSVAEYGRNSSFYALGLLGGPVAVLAGDKIRLSYLTVPSMTFLPG